MLKKLLSRIRDQGEATTGPEALGLVDQARAEHAEAEAHLAAARDAYQASLTADDEKAAIAARAELTRREVLMDRAAAAVGLAERAHAEAEARDAEAARCARYAAAEGKIAVALQALDFYDEYARMIREIMKAVAEANVAASAANADLPEGAAPLVPAERRARGVPGTPEREIRRETLPDTWFYTGSVAMWGEVAAHLHGQIKPTGDRMGVLEGRSPESPVVAQYPVERRPGGVRVLYQPAKPGLLPEALHTQITLPGLRAGDPMIWSPAGELNYLRSMGGDGPAVLAAVAAREGAPRRSDGEIDPDGAPHERVERPAPAEAG